MRKTAAASLIYRADVSLTGPITSGGRATRHPWLPTCGRVRMSSAHETALRALVGTGVFGQDGHGRSDLVSDSLESLSGCVNCGYGSWIILPLCEHLRRDRQLVGRLP